MRAGIGLIQPPDPGRGVVQQRGLAADHHDGVEPADDLEFDDAGAQAGVAGIHDLFQFGDDRLRRAVGDRVDADRLAAHPIDIEAQRGVNRGAPLRAGALNQTGCSPDHCAPASVPPP